MPKFERRILSDLDGVIIDSVIPVSLEASRRLGVKIERDDFTSWDFLYHRALEITGNETKAKEIIGIWFESPILRQSPPIPGSLETLDNWREKEYDIQTATTRVPTSKRVTFEWFGEHLSFIATEKRIHIRRSSDTRSGNTFKRDYTLKFQPHLILDDSAETVRFLAQHLPIELRSRIRLVEAPWNRFAHDLNEIRVASWEQIAKLI